MDLCKRVICRLDIKGSKLIKGIRYEGFRVIGDPYEFAKYYSKQGADEIFYADAVASLYQRNSLDILLKKTSQDIFIPITAGGGIRSLEDGKRLLASGADKLAINTSVVKNPNLINKLVDNLGSQCIVISLQLRKSLTHKGWDVMIESGRERSTKELPRWIDEIQSRGAGEILVTSIDNDGTGNGIDVELYEEVSKYISIPLIFGGGIASKNDINNLIIRNKKISGISVGWAFHKNKLNINEAKNAIKSHNFSMRFLEENKKKIIKKNIKISIVDYAMGNVRSLYNCLSKISNNITVTCDKNILDSSDLIAIPGVGSFPQGMKNLEIRDLKSLLLNRAKQNKPLIGICLGMQLLYEKGEEHIDSEGLGIIEGKITKLQTSFNNKEKLLLPHVGWNKVYFAENFKNTLNLEEDFFQYFVHSYADCLNPKAKKYSIYETAYGKNKFTSAIRKGNTVGLQFHPERSGEKGMYLLYKLIKNLTNL